MSGVAATAQGRLNLALLALALGASLAGGALHWRLVAGQAPARPASADGPRRIASASTLADQVLPDLVEPARIVAVTRWHRDHHSTAFRTPASAAVIPSLDDLEAVLAARPDVVIVSGGFDPRRVRRLRDRGLRVFDTGPLDGAASMLAGVARLGAELGVEDRANEWTAAWRRRFAQVAADIPEPQRPRALVLSIYGSQLTGGTIGSNCHDVLLAGGCRDAAAATHRGWPAYSPEEVLKLAPEVVVCSAGHATRLRAHPGLARLACLGAPRGLVEIPDRLLSDPGPAMLAAAEALRVAVHGERDAQAPRP